VGATGFEPVTSAVCGHSGAVRTPVTVRFSHCRQGFSVRVVTGWKLPRMAQNRAPNAHQEAPRPGPLEVLSLSESWGSKRGPPAGDPLGPVRAYRSSTGPSLRRPPRLCSIEGCGRLHVGRGLCGLHYDRVATTTERKRNGNSPSRELACGSAALALLCPPFFRPTRAARHSAWLRCLTA
jgi:hypothetical protein